VRAPREQGTNGQAERSRNLLLRAFRRAATASASTFNTDTVVSQSMQPSVMRHCHRS
jgi:hypothetical protein